MGRGNKSGSKVPSVYVFVHSYRPWFAAVSPSIKIGLVSVFSVRQGTKLFIKWVTCVNTSGDPAGKGPSVQFPGVQDVIQHGLFRSTTVYTTSSLLSSQTPAVHHKCFQKVDPLHRVFLITERVPHS